MTVSANGGHRALLVGLDAVLVLLALALAPREQQMGWRVRARGLLFWRRLFLLLLFR